MTVAHRATMYDLRMNAASPPSIIRASGIWYATFLSALFALAQADGFHFDRPFVVGLVFWLGVGLALDLWARRQVVRPQASLRELNRPVLWVLALILGFITVGTVFRPPANAAASGGWIVISNTIVDLAQLVLPGLRHARTALTAAGRPDIAAYFGLFQTAESVGWLAMLVFWTRRFSTFPASASRNPAMLEATRTVGSRFFIGGIVWFSFLMAFLMLSTFWHQEVTGSWAGTPRFWHNAIEGGGAFVPGPVVIFGVPLLIFAGMAWRVALRQQRELEMDKRSE